jgi:hypothetical protein
VIHHNKEMEGKRGEATKKKKDTIKNKMQILVEQIAKRRREK